MQLSFDLTPREQGRIAANHCLTKAEKAGFDTQGAAKFILSYLRRHGPTPGEILTEQAMACGFRGHDARCFGPVYLRLMRAGDIRCVRSDLPRKLGHGTSGGKLWSAV